MAYDLIWDHHFCLTCDKQTDGPVYCSEACRLADYEGGATSFAPPSGPGSPSWSPSGSSTYKWAMDAPSARSRQLFSLSPAYDFGNAQPYSYYGPSNSTSTSTYNYTRQPAPPTTSASASASPRHVSLPPTTAATTAATTTTYHHVLSPSSSHSSLSSMRSGMSSTTGSGAQHALSAFAHNSSSASGSSQTSYGSSAASNSSDLSEKVRSELRKYASSLEQGKLQRQLQRRRSC